MERIALADLDPTAVGDGGARRVLTGPLGAAHVAVNHYRVPPGEELPGGLHAHLDQEEVFVVLSGEATFETLAAGEVTVGPRSAVRFAPGEYQSGRNDGDVDLVVLALGAPRDTDDVRVPVPCPDCGFDGLRLETGGDGLTFGCPDCGASHQPAPCPACGDEALRTTLDEANEPVVVCDGCGATYESPPLEA